MRGFQVHTNSQRDKGNQKTPWILVASLTLSNLRGIIASNRHWSNWGAIGMHIEGMTVGPSSHPAFQEPLQLEFDKRVNLFAGPNASGKTSLLRVLAYSGFVDKTAIFPFPAEEVRLSSDWEAMLGTRDGFDDAAIWGVPWIYIPATRLILTGGFDWNDGVQVDDGVEGEIDDVNWQDNARVFDGRWVERVCKVFYDKFKGQLNEGQRDFYGLLQALKTAYSCTKSISNEIMIGRPSNHVSHPYELLADPQDFEPLFDEPYVHPGMGVSTKYGGKQQIPASICWRPKCRHPRHVPVGVVYRSQDLEVLPTT